MIENDRIFELEDIAHYCNNHECQNCSIHHECERLFRGNPGDWDNKDIDKVNEVLDKWFR